MNINMRMALIYLFLPFIFVATLTYRWSLQQTLFSLLTVAAGSFLALVVINLAYKGNDVDPPLQAAKRTKKDTLTVFVMLLLFLMVALWNYQLFPLVLAGESHTPLVYARSISDQIKQGRFISFISLKAYNTGFGLLYACIYPIFGDSMACMKIFTIIIWAIMILLLFLVFQKTHHSFWPLIALYAPLFVTGITLAAIRRYKWHAAALFASVSVFYIVASVQKQKVFRCSRATVAFFGIFLFALSLLMYHGAILYVPILLFILVIEVLLNGRENIASRKTWALVVLILLMIPGIIFFLRHSNSSRFYGRVVYVTFSGVGCNTELLPTIIRSGHSFFHVFFNEALSFPLSIVFLLGIASGIRQFRKDWFSRTTIIMFFVLAALLSATYGFGNYDENSYLIIPFIGFLCLGFYDIGSCLEVLFHKRRLTILLLGISIALTIIEARNYYSNRLYKYSVRARGSTTEAAIMLMNIRDMLEEHPGIEIFFPSKRANRESGGFAQKTIYDLPYFQKELNHIRVYDSISDLTNNIRLSPKVPKLVYYSHSADPAKLDKVMERTPQFTTKCSTTPYPTIWPELSIHYLAVGANLDSNILDCSKRGFE